MADPLLEEAEEDSATSQYRCVDCGASSPPTRTAHTLISAKHGWRLSRKKLSDGSTAYEWRCQGCFTAAKARSAL